MAEFEVITPMFLGDGLQQAKDIRPPAIKGALRFWWRAINWSKFYQTEGQNEKAALKALHTKEAELFGSSAKTVDGQQVGGQGKVAIKLTQKLKESNGWSPSGSAQYLLGMGLHHFKSGLLRDYIASGSTFTLHLLCRDLSNEDQADIVGVVKAMGLLGGLGARARKGLGSVSITELSVENRNSQSKEYITLPNDAKSYVSAIQSLLANCGGSSLPPFTAFSKDSLVDLSFTDKSADAVFTKVGNSLQMYRSYGRNGKVNGQKTIQLFKYDHDLMLENRQTQLPKRAVFGLPHNYFFSSAKKKVDVNAVSRSGEARRASPLFIHVHKLSDQEFLAVQLLLPAVFLDSYEHQVEIKTQKKGTQKLSVQNNSFDYQVIRNYMTLPKYQTEQGSYPGFQNRQQIWPIKEGN